jgi:hypothetical protein
MNGRSTQAAMFLSNRLPAQHMIRTAHGRAKDFYFPCPAGKQVGRCFGQVALEKNPARDGRTGRPPLRTD